MAKQRKCSECGRPLQAGEGDMCPACDAEAGRILGMIGKGMLAVGGIILVGWKILTGRKGSESA